MQHNYPTYTKPDNTIHVLYIYCFQVSSAQVSSARSLRSLAIQQQAVGMRRIPLFFGTPFKPSQCGSLAYLHDDAAFPVLGPVQATCPTSSRSSGQNYLQAVLASSQVPLSETSPCTTQTPMTRKDCQFQVRCEQIDAKIEAYQHDGAKTILSNMLSNEHTEWLKRLKYCLTNNVPMAKPIQPPPKKHYYKRSFRPVYVDTFQPPMPIPYVTVLPKVKPAPYRYWTDVAISVYGDSLPGHEADYNASPKKPQCVRPSSYVKTANKFSPLFIPEVEPIWDEQGITSGISGSKHTYQYLSYHKQHDSCAKYLLMDDTTRLDYNLRYKNSDPTGTFRAQQRHLRQTVDLYLRRELALRNITAWGPILQQADTLLTLLRTMKPHTRQSQPIAQPTVSSTGQSSSESTAPQDTTGTGIDHFKITHRLQKRHHRRIQFERHLEKHSLVQSIACSQNSHPSCAPASRQHRTNVVLDDVLHEAAIAPLDFRQHQVSSFESTLSAPNFGLHSVDALHDDSLEHMGNLHFTDGGIFTPLFSSPHVLTFSPCDHSAPILQRHCSLTNPDGPGNILLFDEQNTRKRSKQEPLRPHVPVGLGNEQLLCLYTTPESYMDFQHMGKFLPINLTNSITTYLSPHAGPTFVHVPFANSFDQEAQKRPQQESNPQDRPNLLSFGPGDFSTHIYQKQPQYFPSGPGATDYHEYQEAEKRAKRCIALYYLHWLSEPPHDDPLISFSHGTFDSTTAFRCAPTEPFCAVPLPAESSNCYNATIWQEALLGAHISTSSALDSPARDRLIPYEHYNVCLWQQILAFDPRRSNVFGSKISICKEPQFDPLVQSFSERDSSLLPPSSSLYPPQSKLDLDPTPSHLPSYGISYSQVQVLLSLHKLTFCHLFRDYLDWLTQLVTPKETQGIFFHQSHWYAYSQDRHRVHVLLRNSNDPLCTFLKELTFFDSPFHTLSFYFYYAPPTPRGLCGLVAISSLCCLLGHQTQLPALQLSGYTLHWKYSKAVRELHTHYASIVASTSKHFSCGPIGFMDNENPVDSCDDPFTITDTMSPQVPGLHPDTFSIPLISPNFSHEPITYNLHLTDSELAIKRSFRIEITPVWTVQHVIDSLQTTLGHSSTSLILTQQGRTLPQYFDPWRALPSYTLKPLTAKIPPTLSIHQGRQLAKPLRYCTCNTLCATTHELTKRTITSFGNPQINVCIFRHPVNNNLFVLPICSITTPTHIHARFLPYNAVFWIPVVNDTFVSMDSILIHYGTPVALEFYELPLTRGIHTDTLYGTSLFHLRIQDPGTMTYRPYKRIILQPNPHLHRFVDIALIIEPTLTVEELELTLENFLRLNLDCLQPPRDQPVGTLVRNTIQQTYQVLVGEDPYAIRHNLYNPLFPKMATRPYPPNHDYWTISDQFCSFLQSVPKTSETTFRDVFYDHFRYDHFDYTSIRSIVFNNETWHLYDFVPITSCDRIVYVLSPIRLDLHLLEINTHVYLTVSPLTQISHLKQLLETYTHISKHHNILPYSDDDFVTILPQPTFIGFHPTDRSDSATLASQLTDLSTLTGSADPSLLALEDDPDPFLHIPFHYWVTDIDIDFVFSNLLQDDIHWFPPLSFRQGYAYLCSDSTFLTTFVFQSHWYACFFSAPDQEQRELDSHLLITRDSLPTAFLFVPPGFSSSQKHDLLQNIATLLPICNIDYVYATLSLPGLCGITLIQCLFNWMSSHTSVPLPLRLRCLTYSNFDFTHLSLFFQSTELRRRHPLASQQFTFRAGAPSTDPNPTSNTISDTTSPSPSTAAIPTLSGTTSYEVIQSCQDQEASHSLLSATQLAQFPQVMRHLVILQLPPTIGVHTLQNLFPENKPPLPPTGKIHVLLMAQEAVWRKTAILPVTFTHAQRLQYLLPGFRCTLYEQLDHNIHNAWISLPKLEATTSEPYIQYRIQFKKFLIPVHIQQTRHSCLLEVWPWYTIQDVIQLLQTILHLPADALTPQNHPHTTHLATISRRLLLVFDYQRTPTLLNYSLDFPLPPDVLINPRCWCHTVCTHTILTSINTERTRQSLYLNLLFVILPTSRQLVLINQCQAGTFKQLLTYLLPQRSNIQQHFVLGDLTAFPLHFNLPTPEQISYAVFVHLPRHILRFPTIDDHIALFRYAAESEFQHPDLFPITINWHVSTTNPPLCRQVFTLPYLSLGDLLRAIKNFCGTHHVVNLTPDLPPSTLLSNTPQPVVFTVTHLSHYENDHYSIETLEVYLNDNLSILPRDKWFTLRLQKL